MTRPARVLLVAVLLLAGCGEGDSPPRERQNAPLVATLGDSYTAGAPRWSANEEARERVLGDRATVESQWQHWAREALGGAVRFRNCGVEGERTDEIALRLDQCVEGAETIVVQGGTNDVVQGRPVAAAAANIREIVRAGRAAGLRTFVATVPPLNLRYPEWAEEIRRLNGLIRSVAREEGIPVIDFFEALEDPRRPGRMRADWNADRAHPTVEGYARMGRVAARSLRASPRRRP